MTDKPTEKPAGEPEAARNHQLGRLPTIPDAADADALDAYLREVRA